MKCNPWVGGSIGRRGFPMLGTGKRGLSTYVKELFKNGEQGFFYDPNDLTTMFQDASGTVPVTAVGQPVSLWLDKSKNMLLSSEKNPNPSFNANLAGWAVGNATSATFENGEARVTFGGVLSATANNWFSLEGTYSVGKVYTVSFDATYVSGGDLQAGFGYTPGIVVRGSQNLGIKQKYTFTSGGFNSASRLFAFAASSAGSVWKIDNVSVKEVLGNHAYQTTSAARPIFRQKPILGSELVVNGDFNNGFSGWTQIPAGWWSVVGGRAYHKPSSSYNELSYGISRLNSVIVSFDYEILSENSTTQWFYLDSTGAVKIQPMPTGSGKITLTITDGIQRIGFSRFGGKVADFYIDNVSIKEITGYRTDQNYIEYDGIDDKLITNLPSQLTNCTVIRSAPNVGTQILTGQTIPATYEDNKDHCGLIVINRALTPSETAAIATEFNKRAGV